MSGYCLMLPVLARSGLRGGMQGFYAGRAGRILPAYYAAAALALSLIASGLWRPDDWMDDISLGVTGRGVMAKLLIIHNLWPPPFFGGCGNVAIGSSQTGPRWGPLALDGISPGGREPTRGDKPKSAHGLSPHKYTECCRRKCQAGRGLQPPSPPHLTPPPSPPLPIPSPRPPSPRRFRRCWQS